MFRISCRDTLATKSVENYLKKINACKKPVGFINGHLHSVCGTGRQDANVSPEEERGNGDKNSFLRYRSEPLGATGQVYRQPVWTRQRRQILFIIYYTPIAITKDLLHVLTRRSSSAPHTAGYNRRCTLKVSAEFINRLKK